MTTFRITNKTSGADLGTYEADDKAGALEAMAQDARTARSGVSTPSRR